MDEGLDEGLDVLLVEFAPSGGLFQFAYQEGAALAARGHRVELVTGPRPELPDGVPGMRVVPVLPTWHPHAGAAAPVLVRRVRRCVRAVRYVAAWWRLARYVRARRPDVVQWSDWRFGLDGRRVARLARRVRRWPRPPVLLYLAHSPRPFNEQRRGGAVFKNGRAGAGGRGGGLGRGYAAVDVVLVLGADSARVVRAERPGVRRVEVLPHGDEDLFLPAGADPGDDGPVALFFGTLAAYKGADLLIEAFAGVRARVPGARLVIAGSPSAEVDTAALARRAAAVGGVRLRPGYVPLDQVAALVRTARVVVLPYRAANASGVAHLAHSLSRPVVVTAVGDLAASVDPGTTGLVVPPGDGAALTDAVGGMLADPARAARMGAAGRRALSGRSAWPGIAARLETIVREAGDDAARRGEAGAGARAVRREGAG